MGIPKNEVWIFCATVVVVGPYSNRFYFDYILRDLLPSESSDDQGDGKRPLLSYDRGTLQSKCGDEEFLYHNF